MTMAITEIYELMNGLPPGAWVAISTEQHRVLSYGEDADQVVAEAEEKGEEHPFLTRVPDPNEAMFF